ncbi:MAG: hypothetical protein A2W01_07670 [Candidatus Solincola sediminis]|uniref:Uncharacterized protein n=1 Tax=Candidatus Solincola sediminis TaxID=1797199 RepID=A0A1F2WIZ8_9ACTN|nr:MAG: hypothetical protein A2W01_07670 [Candidatus Solincola sediminis]OFW56801.1 MAG: hypothetical protein A2Y75_06420 [Candidatus Solincola sediminis]
MGSRKTPSVLLILASVLVILLAGIHLAGCGLTRYDPIKVCNGYTLISNDDMAKLLDMNGNVIKTWNTPPACSWSGSRESGYG